MAGFNDLITRTDVPIPTEEVGELLKVMPEESVLLKRARRQPMSTKTVKQTIMTTFPDAYWVDGDTGLKQTTKQSFSQPTMTAEELAVIAVVPDAVIDDSSLPIWETLRPYLAEAIGKKVDAAAIYGTDKPASWPLALVPGAIAAGVITPGNLTATPADQRKDAGQLVADLGLRMARDAGANLSGLIAQAGTGWELDRIRDADRRPIYDGVAGALRGVPFDELKNGAWSDVGTGDTAVPLIGVDWSQVYVGIRHHRDVAGGGVIRFWPAFGLGLGISAVAGLVYVAAWELCLVLADRDFAAFFANSMVEGARSKGVDGAQLEQVIAEAQAFEAMYRNPLVRMPMTFVEIFPVGVLVSLVSALVLRRPRAAR